jgi:hypothetical protein
LCAFFSLFFSEQQRHSHHHLIPQTAALSAQRPLDQELKSAMYGSSSQSHVEQQPLLPSYSPVVTRREHGDAHVAPAWPTTFEKGVDA